MRRYLKGSLFLTLCCIFFKAYSQDSGNGGALVPSWSAWAEWQSYNSYSQQNGDMPMKAGYPVVQAQMPAIGIGYHLPFPWVHHQFKLSFSIPSGLDSDDGTGEDHMLRDNFMAYAKAGLDYHLTFPLFRWKKLKARHGLNSGLLYEFRNLFYLSGAKERTRDINLYLGPVLQLTYRLDDNWTIQGGFDARFYLPYVNYGALLASNARGMTVYSSNYQGFYYQTIFSLEAAYRLPSEKTLKAGIRKNDLVGFAGRKPSFVVEEVVHFKLDRMYHYYIEYQF